MKEKDIEKKLIRKLRDDLKYTHRDDITDKDGLNRNFKEKFEQLNRVKLTDTEFERLKDEIINPNVYESAKLLRERSTFMREDGTPLQYTLVNINDWCIQ